jgi:hypothetical protein
VTIQKTQSSSGYTLAETLVAVAIASFMLAVIMVASIGLQKSYNAVDNFFSVQVQQIRICDYLNRDAKRSYIVTVSADQKTVTCIMPRYVVSNVRATPTLTPTSNGTFVSYPNSRSINDGVTTSGSSTVTSATANFTASDVGLTLYSANIPAGATIQSVTNTTTAVLSANATTTATAQILTVNPSVVIYSINGNSIFRTEDGTVTNIASSTDQLTAYSSDSQIDSANTEYVTSQVVFQPVFATGGNNANQYQQTGTTMFATSYLRNKRRG